MTEGSSNFSYRRNNKLSHPARTHSSVSLMENTTLESWYPRLTRDHCHWSRLGIQGWRDLQLQIKTPQRLQHTDRRLLGGLGYPIEVQGSEMKRWIGSHRFHLFLL